MKTELEQNILNIKKRIQSACLLSGRDPAEVKLLLATKTVSTQRISEALLAGETLIAENKIQELKEKFHPLSAIPHTNHFIGHLQTNKVKDLLKYNVSCLQSLDNMDLAHKLNNRLSLEDKKMDVLIQVNTSAEQSKFGLLPQELASFVEEVSTLEHLQVKGLMTIGLFTQDPLKIRPCFSLLKELQQQIAAENIPGVQMHELSMGMSGDLEIAIQEGATIIRVGTAIFGKRATPDSYYWNEKP